VLNLKNEDRIQETVDRGLMVVRKNEKLGLFLFLSGRKMKISNSPNFSTICTASIISFHSVNTRFKLGDSNCNFRLFLLVLASVT